MKRMMIVVAALAALSACGATPTSDRQVASLTTAAADDTTPGTDDASGTTAPSDPAEAALQFAQCMREHGIDMPDPQFSGDGNFGIAISSGPDDSSNSGGPPFDPNSQEFKDANEACGQNGGGFSVSAAAVTG